MKSDVILFFCILSLFIAVVWTADNTTVPEDTCAALTEDQKCCNTTGCKWFTCEKETTNGTEAANITKCHQDSWTGSEECKNDTQRPICETPAPTTASTVAPETDQCTAGTDKASCCAKDNCTFTNCTSQDQAVSTPIEVCVKDPLTLCQPGTFKDQCKPEKPTTAPPTVTPPTDVCESYENDSDCCSHGSVQNCTYIKCTGLDDNPHTGCHVNTSDMTKFCKDEVQLACTTPKPDVTTASVTTQSSDSSANTGQEEHGQHFDGASFIGGIVLCLGLVAIVFFGLKFYRARTERNYHTL